MLVYLAARARTLLQTANKTAAQFSQSVVQEVTAEPNLEFFPGRHLILHFLFCLFRVGLCLATACSIYACLSVESLYHRLLVHELLVTQHEEANRAPYHDHQTAEG